MDKNEKNLDCYLAGPWFTDGQMARLELIKSILTSHGVTFFSPKDENLFKPGMSTKDVLNANLIAMDSSQFILAITDGKDVGTMFECGWAHANNIPILYVWLTREKDQKFNLMLAASGSFVTTEKELRHALHHWLYEGKFNCEYGVDDDLIE
jgi:nucleoside 2-deoxyribosyltransferase